jgi:hypothetical protein
MTQRRNQPVSKVAPCDLMSHNAACVAGMAEQVDARDSKSRAERRAGSIPAPGTKQIQTDSNRFKQIQTDSNRFKQIQTDSNRFKQIQTDSNRFKQIQADSSSIK